ncbi:hypothetical protein MLD38_017369 [Melastoma candidum]|uniref:Uncharacterized protein n=1 Tax=Melastoma candidum TaxID=119954 RepID=A0ACB9QSB3_9MYRT|nr:hypothetical protein MLD38_017369 [Melastoma candidum]
MWVYRAGIKANITENFSRQSKFTYGLVVEEVTTCDESSHVCPTGQRVLTNGGNSADGPPTTLSGTGINRLAFFQASITRDNTKYVNGAIQNGFDYIGSASQNCLVLQLDQCLGVGTNFPFFNCHQLTWTGFIQPKKVEAAAGKPPPAVLVLHSHYNGFVGDFPSYEVFTLGVLYSV